MSLDLGKDFVMTAEFLQPWSTFVMKTVLPPIVLEKMIKITDDIIEKQKIVARSPDQRYGTDPDNRSRASIYDVTWERSGSGQMNDEFSVEPSILEGENILGFFSEAVRHFVIQQTLQVNPYEEDRKNILDDEWYTQIKDMWTVSQKDNEYQPMHMHPNAPVAAVMYLKIPDFLPSRNPTRNEDGTITFINNVGKDQVWGTPFMTLHPEVGDFFIFPSSQLHLVYPFRTADGMGERRSVSFNAHFSNKSEQEQIKQQSLNDNT
jgi:hypothetical protein